MPHEISTAQRVWKAGEGALRELTGPAMFAVGMGAVCAGALALAPGGAVAVMALPWACAAFAAGFAALGVGGNAIHGWRKAWKDPQADLGSWKELSIQGAKVAAKAMIGVGLGLAACAGAAAMAPAAPPASAVLATVGAGPTLAAFVAGTALAARGASVGLDEALTGEPSKPNAFLAKLTTWRRGQDAPAASKAPSPRA